MAKKKTRRDTAEIARSVVEQAIGGKLSKSAADTAKDPAQENGRDPVAVEVGRRGGIKGGRVRAERLTAERRSEIARCAAKARWEKYRERLSRGEAV